MKEIYDVLYICLNPRLIAEIPLEDVHTSEMIEKEMNPPEVFWKTSFIIFSAVLWAMLGNNGSNSFDISCSEITINCLNNDIKRVIKGIEETRI